MNTLGLKYWLTVGIWLTAVILLVLIEHYSVFWYQWDYSLLCVAYRLRSFQLDGFFSLITWAGSLAILVPITGMICTFLGKFGRFSDAWLLVLSLAGSALFSRLAKIWFVRPRPDLFPVIGVSPLDFSFPSVHTAQIVAFTVALACTLKLEKLGLTYYFLVGIFLLLSALVAISRIYLQVHYPSDVLGGAVMGLLWVLGLFISYR